MGLLNFLTRAIYLGRVYTRRIYTKVQAKTSQLKSYHHVNLDQEFRWNCKVWLHFLQNQYQMTTFCRAFTDLDAVIMVSKIGFYTESFANRKLGFGGICSKLDWFFGQWEPNYIQSLRPSIEYLELYAVAVRLFLYGERFSNQTLLLHCDNNSVMQMLNNTTSGCEHCMHLLRMIILRGLYYNFRVRAHHVGTRANGVADSLSILQWDRFLKLTGGSRNKFPTLLPHELWPASKIWRGAPGLEEIN